MAALQPFHIQIHHSIDIDTAHPSPLPVVVHPIDIYAGQHTLKLPHRHSAALHVTQPQWGVTQLAEWVVTWAAVCAHALCHRLCYMAAHGGCYMTAPALCRILSLLQLKYMDNSQIPQLT